ncbi:MAG: P-loop NTPase [Spirochaetota bacterium]
MHIIPIASGKGGVGKSLLAANLALVLARMGHRVVLADLDFGGSNLHLILGIRGVTTGLGTFLNASGVAFNDVILDTEYENLRFIPGDGEVPGIANLGSGQKRKLINRLKSVDADFLVLDLGAGTSFNVMDFFLLSRQGIVVTAPTPTALVNAYLCIKNALFRLLTTAIKRGTVGDERLKELTRNPEHLQRVYLPDLVKRLEEAAPEAVAAFRESAAAFRPRVVLNLLDDPADVDKVTRLRRSCTQYLGLEIEHLGVMYRDELQDVSLSARLPIILYKPNSVLSQAITRIAEKVAERSDDNSEQGAWLDAEESFADAYAEAESDFEVRTDYVNELLHTGALSQGDLLETVKTQQIEINQLRRENDLLKAKIVRAANAGYDVR